MDDRPPSRLGRLVTFTLISLVSLASFGHLWSHGVLSASSLIGFRDFWAHNLVLGEVTDLVNVFIGTAGEGHVFPGATVPHGMVKAGMDTDGRGAHAGYLALPEFKVIGFSQLHEDGTGGAIPLSNFKLFPVPQSQCMNSNMTTCPVALETRKVRRDLNDDGTPQDSGSPGYFKTKLETGVQIELTATRKTALHRYTFPSSTDGTNINHHVVVDLTNDGQKSGHKTELKIEPERGRVTGGATFYASFGRGSYRAFVCADFAEEIPEPSSKPSKFHPHKRHDLMVRENLLTPTKYGTYLSNMVFPGNTTLEGGVNYNQDQGAILAFGSNTVVARVGISLISAEQACHNAESEIPSFGSNSEPATSTFELVRQAAKEEWRKLLGRFDLHVFDGKGDNVDLKMASLFYSSVYRSHIVPADYSEENPLWNSTEPYYDSLYCNWDTYRTLFPLLSLQDPDTYSRIVRSFIDIQKNEGWLPECRSATTLQFIQGGTSGDPILAEFFVKYQEHLDKYNISSDDLYAALVKDAELEGTDWNFKGRQAGAWKEFGYLPVGEYYGGGTNTRQVSRTLEYAFDDFTISQVAQLLGKEDDTRKYQNRSRGFELVWNTETRLFQQEKNGRDRVVGGIKGFMQPRYKNGTFGHTDPRHCTVHDPTHSSCFLDAINKDGFYEGGPIVYSQYVPHDTAKLIELQGGNDAFIRRLDYIFDNGYFDSTNEPSQQIPYMYHYANKPGLTADRVRDFLSRSPLYNTSIWGLPGNDDSGAMGSYVAFNLLGIYPLPATKQFLVSSPFFPRITVHNPLYDSRTTIISHNFDGHDGRNIYIKGIKVNGSDWKSTCFVEWEAFTKSTTIELVLTNDRNVPCGQGKDALPPSLSTGGYGSAS